MVPHRRGAAERKRRRARPPDRQGLDGTSSAQEENPPCAAGSRAGATGLEPATSGVTGRRSNQLNYAPAGRPSVAAPVPRGTGPVSTLQVWAQSTGSRSRSSCSQRSPGCGAGSSSARSRSSGSRRRLHRLPRRDRTCSTAGRARCGRRFAVLVGAVLGAVLFQTVAVVAGSFLRGGLRFTPLRLLDSAGGLLLGVVIGARDRLGLRRRRAPDARRDRAPPRRPALVDRRAARLRAAAAHTARPARAHRSVPVDHRPVGADAAASRGVLARPRRSARPLARRQGARHGVRGRRRGERLVRRAATSSSPRRTSSPASAARLVEIPGQPLPALADVVVLRRPQRRRRAPRLRTSTAQPLRLADPQDGRRRRDRRLPARRNLTAIPGRIGRTANACSRRTRSATGRSRGDHRRRGTGRARRLRRAGDRHGRPRRGDDLRREARLAERLRRPDVDRPQRPRERRHARRVDRRPARPRLARAAARRR